MTKKQAAKEQAKEYLLEQLFDDQGDLKKIHVIFKHVSPSGMTRVYQVYTQDWQNLTWNFCQLLGGGWDKNRLGIKVVGCGMDMSRDLLDRVLYELVGNDKPENWYKKVCFHS